MATAGFRIGLPSVHRLVKSAKRGFIRAGNAEGDQRDAEQKEDCEKPREFALARAVGLA